MSSSGAPAARAARAAASDVVGGERDVLRVRDAGGPLAAAQQARGEHQPHPARGYDPVAHQAERGGDLVGRLRGHTQHRPVEQRSLVELVVGLGESDVVDAR